MAKPIVEVVEKGFTLLPPAPDVCQVCAGKHDPDEPHNPESLFWQTARVMKGEPEATWKDAIAHCSPEMQQAWVDELAKHGVVVEND